MHRSNKRERLYRLIGVKLYLLRQCWIEVLSTKSGHIRRQFAPRANKLIALSSTRSCCAEIKVSVMQNGTLYFLREVVLYVGNIATT